MELKRPPQCKDLLTVAPEGRRTSGCGSLRALATDAVIIELEELSKRFVAYVYKKDSDQIRKVKAGF
uniref:ADF-H domain-containing protein n=1 Tax=Ascaris lumbricoides TaxID=6252 RepID=A0A0M3HN89_ASCLU